MRACARPATRLANRAVPASFTSSRWRPPLTLIWWIDALGSMSARGRLRPRIRASRPTGARLARRRRSRRGSAAAGGRRSRRRPRTGGRDGRGCRCRRANRCPPDHARQLVLGIAWPESLRAAVARRTRSTARRARTPPRTSTRGDAPQIRSASPPSIRITIQVILFVGAAIREEGDRARVGCEHRSRCRSHRPWVSGRARPPR